MVTLYVSFFLSCIISISLTYMKNPLISCSVSSLNIRLCSIYCNYVPATTADVGAPTDSPLSCYWLSKWIKVVLGLWVECLFHQQDSCVCYCVICCVLHSLYLIWYFGVHIFNIKWTYSIYLSVVCEYLINWTKFLTLYVYGRFIILFNALLVNFVIL